MGMGGGGVGVKLGSVVLLVLLATGGDTVQRTTDLSATPVLALHLRSTL